MDDRCTLLIGRLATLGSCLLAAEGALEAQPLHFAGERVVITVAGDRCSVTGEYHFRNPGPVPVQAALLYPFPVTPLQPMPDSILVEDVLGRSAIVPTAMDSAVAFPVRIPPSSTRIYRVSFLQRTPARRFEYILTTTRRWPWPVAHAEFSIVLPGDLTMRSCSLVPDTVIERSWGRTYRIERDQFVPEENLILRWERSSP